MADLTTSKPKCGDSDVWCIKCKNIQPMKDGQAFEKTFSYKDRAAVKAGDKDEKTGKVYAKDRAARVGKPATRQFSRGACGGCGSTVSRLSKAAKAQ